MYPSLSATCSAGRRHRAIRVAPLLLAVSALVSPGLSAQVITPSASDVERLQQLSGPYRSSYGHEISVASNPDGLVRIDGSGEHMSLQWHADQALRGSFTLSDPFDRREKVGTAQVLLDQAPRTLHGSIADPRDSGASFHWSACRVSDPRIAARFAGVDLWLSPRSVAVSGSNVTIFLNAQTAGLTWTPETSPVTLQLQDASGSVEAKGRLYAIDPLPDSTRVSPCQDIVLGFTFERPGFHEGKAILTFRGLTRVAWTVRPGRASGEFQDTDPAAPPVPVPNPPAGGGGTPDPRGPVPGPQPNGPSVPGPAAPSDDPAPQPAPPSIPTGGGFKSLGKWDVRLDRIDLPRDDELVHVYLTFRNATRGVLWQTQGIQVRLGGDDGVTEQNGQSLRAVEGPLRQFPAPPAVDPGTELPAKFVFSRREGANPSSVTVIEGDKRVAFTSGAGT
ncbi:hypothetical protein [Allosphingosinicella deserti]|uniref:hypothetical protein n=1 Tax=Allosphingosinicella deserti TaxID=2116704 RepID=UPI0018EDCE2A|nr:hypothetical protein [Sphingomonas deserti]